MVDHQDKTHCAIHCSENIKNTFLSIKPSEIPCLFKPCLSHHSKHTLFATSEQQNTTILARDGIREPNDTEVCDLNNFKFSLAEDLRLFETLCEYDRDSLVMKHMLETCNVSHKG